MTKISLMLRIARHLLAHFGVGVDNINTPLYSLQEKQLINTVLYRL